MQLLQYSISTTSIHDLSAQRDEQMSAKKLYSNADNDRQYHVPIGLLKRFEQLKIPNQFHNLAAIEKLGDYSDKELQALVKWKLGGHEGKVNRKLIGACLVERGFRATLLLLSWLGYQVLPSKIIDLNDQKNEYKIIYDNWKVTQFTSSNSYKTNKNIVDDLLLGYSKLEKKINYKFQDRLLLLQAVTHRSFTTNTITPANHHLAFLGDAVLEYLITVYLYHHPNKFNGSQINRVRCVLGSNLAFCNALIRSGIYKYLRYIDDNIDKHIIRHVKWHKIQKFQIQTDVCVCSVYVISSYAELLYN